jgi:hypothetical protein
LILKEKKLITRADINNSWNTSPPNADTEER